MNRQERRKKEREIEKDMNILRKLPEKEVLKINEIINKIAKTKAEEALNLIDRSFSAVLVNEGWSFKEIKRIQDIMSNFMIEDQEKIKLLEKENIDMAKLQEEVKVFMGELIRSGKSRQDVIKETIFKFPKLSKTAINNAYGKIQEEIEIEDAAAYILEDTKKIKTVVKKEEAKKVSDELSRQLKKDIEKKHTPEAGQMVVNKEFDGLEVLEEVVIKEIKVKGANGVYNAKTGLGVALENEGYKIAFSNIEELENFCREFKKVFSKI